ncbi:hypothetical protein B0H11DRAFT_1983502 [Mycena galericulata]|nr:hypothetical protein B0H11DRAFT_1983502 [Mycena galericulata]
MHSNHHNSHLPPSLHQSTLAMSSSASSPGPSGPSSPPSDPPAPLTPEQLAVQAITAQLSVGTATEDTRKRKKPDDEENEGIVNSYKDYGRAFLRIGDPFTSVDDIIQHGIFVETTEEIDYPEMSVQKRQIFDRLTESWEILWRMIGPDFRQSMIKLSKQRRLRKRVAAQITAGITGSRGEDANTLKKCIPDYINVDATIAVNPPIPKKILRGFNHPVTARLCCPAKHPPTAATYEAIDSGAIKLSGQHFRRFFYPDDWVYAKDPETGTDNLDEGLLEGHLMPRVAKCILQGPSAALKPPGFQRGNRGNAAKISCRAVTSRLVGYFAFQTCFAISSLENWGQVDGNFDYEQFYWTVVGLFDDGENSHVLEAFNHHVFGDVAGRPNIDSTPSDKEAAEEDESDLDAYKALRAAKKAKRAADAEAAAAAAAAEAAAASQSAAAAEGAGSSVSSM